MTDICLGRSTIANRLTIAENDFRSFGVFGLVKYSSARAQRIWCSARRGYGPFEDGVWLNTHRDHLAAAIQYADLGYSVLPCAPGRKRPCTEHGLLDATIDQTQIRYWWTESPQSNVAIRTDGLLVVDIDGPDNAWLTGDRARLEELAVAPTAMTPRGGRHYVFRQPEGRRWRNTAGRLAEHVDTRADGGYILVEPSLVDGISYRWVEDRGLIVPPEDLPEPPVWLISMLNGLTPPTPGAFDRTDGHLISEGQRNSTLARMAGAMRRVGMSKSEILAGLRRVNDDRCTPPLPDSEIEAVADSIARYAPSNYSLARPGYYGPPDGSCTPLLEPISVGELIASDRALRPPVITGLLRRGETMNVIAPPKIGKSWLVLGMAMCIATGRPWLDSLPTVQGDVLIVDNELHLETLIHRLPLVATALGIGIHEIDTTLNVQSLRGRLSDIFAIGQHLESLGSGRFTLVVLDAFYRVLPRDMNENDNRSMADVYNYMDNLSDRLGCSFVLIHHVSKGNQSARAVTDVGAGAGSQSRAADTHLILRPHQDPGVIVLDAVTRSWPAIQPIALRWAFPMWKPAADIDPNHLKSERSGRRKTKDSAEKAAMGQEWTIDRFIEVFLTDKPATKAEIRERARGVPNFSERRTGR